MRRLFKARIEASDHYGYRKVARRSICFFVPADEEPYAWVQSWLDRDPDKCCVDIAAQIFSGHSAPVNLMLKVVKLREIYPASLSGLPTKWGGPSVPYGYYQKDSCGPVTIGKWESKGGNI